MAHNADFLTTHEVYEPANDAWSTAAPLPSPREARWPPLTGPDGLIYAIGGADVQQPASHRRRLRSRHRQMDRQSADAHTTSMGRRQSSAMTG